MVETSIIALPAFQALLRKKRRFLVSLVLFFFTFYFVLPILAAFTTILQRRAFPGVAWAWVLAFAQFVMTWVICWLYQRKAREFDSMVQQLKADT